MPVKASKKIAIAHRRQQVADLYLRGMTQTAIAKELGVSQPAISKDLKAIHEDWREGAVRDFDLAREIELRKLNRVEREAWAAWERSQEASQEATVSGDEPGSRSVKRIKSQYGDARFLEIVHKCVASRRALLGLDAPTRMEIDDGCSLDERRARVLAVVASLRQRAGTGSAGNGSGVTEPRLICGDGDGG